MLESSLRLGTVAGIRIGVHYTWFVIFVMLTLSLSSYFNATQGHWRGATAFLTAVTTSLMFFASIVLHELGHSLVAIRRGIPVRAITLFIFGGVAQSEKDADTAATEFWVAIAGPAVSFVLAGLFYLLAQATAAINEPVSAACDWLAHINLVVAIFNLLPGFPLDGGRVFRALVWGVSGDVHKGMRWAVAGGRSMAYGLMLVGMFIVMLTGQVLSGLWLAAIGWFLLSAAESSGRAFTMQRLLREHTVAAVMRRDVPRVAPSVAVLAWIDEYALASGERAFLVAEDDTVVGLVTLADARKVGRTDWPHTRVELVMTPVSALQTVTPDVSLGEVLRIMQQHGYNQVPVVIDGEIRGWVDRLRLLQVAELRGEIGR